MNFLAKEKIKLLVLASCPVKIKSIKIIEHKGSYSINIEINKKALKKYGI